MDISFLGRKFRESQVALEAAIIFVLALFFAVGIIRIWVWSHAQVAGRQNAYNDSRVVAGTVEGETPDFMRFADNALLTQRVDDIMNQLRNNITARGGNVSSEQDQDLRSLQEDLERVYGNYPYGRPSGGASADEFIRRAEEISNSSNQEDLEGLADDIYDNTNYGNLPEEDSDTFTDNSNEVLEDLDETFSSSSDEDSQMGNIGSGIEGLNQAIREYIYTDRVFARPPGSLFWPVYRPKTLKEYWAVPKSPLKK